MLKCKRKTDPKIPADSGFLCNKAPVSAAVLKEMITGTQSIAFYEADTKEKTVKRGYTLMLLFSAA
jgi:hypothetical protein